MRVVLSNTYQAPSGQEHGSHAWRTDLRPPPLPSPLPGPAGEVQGLYGVELNFQPTPSANPRKTPGLTPPDCAAIVP